MKTSASDEVDVEVWPGAQHACLISAAQATTATPLTTFFYALYCDSEIPTTQTKKETTNAKNQTQYFR